jgi:hypothetical protein
MSNLPTDQIYIAKPQALSQAAPGSTAEILRVSPLKRQLGPFSLPPTNADVDVLIVPPPITLSEEDFKKLSYTIQQSEAQESAGPDRGLSLGAIRAYQPGLN